MRLCCLATLHHLPSRWDLRIILRLCPRLLRVLRGHVHAFSGCGLGENIGFNVIFRNFGELKNFVASLLLELFVVDGTNGY